MGTMQFESYDSVMHNKIIVVPDYQRDYSWSNSEVATLIEDLRFLYEQNLKEGDIKHFIGSIVLIPLDESISKLAKEISENQKLGKYDKFNVIDGQQRITTLSLLFIAIRDYAKEKGVELDELSSMQGMIDTGKKDDDKNGIPVLHFSQDNTQKCFDSLLYKTDLQFNPKRIGAKRLLTAKAKFDEELATLFNGDTDIDAHLNIYAYQVLYNLQLVEIDCNQDSDAFQIFESLNATGVPLTPAEQVKNLVLMRSGSKDVSLSTWEKMVEATGESNLVDFLSQYLFCRENRRVSRKEIYKKFKEALKTTKVSDILAEMCSYAKSYQQFKVPPAGLAAANALKDLDDLGQRQAYVPLLLAANRFGITSKDFSLIADAVLVFIVRHLVCAQSSNKLDSVFSDACDVIKNEANTAQDVVSFFKSKQMEDSVFIQMFKDQSFSYSTSSQRKARVFLRRIEEKSKGSNAPLLLQQAELSVEHIIPKQPSIEQLEGWIGKDKADELRKNDPKLDDFSEQTIKNIGNLALLYVPENSSAHNKDYATKKQCYTQSVTDKDGNNRGIPSEVFSLIKDLLKEYPEEFTPESVKERAGSLAKSAADAWK